ncbi:MAG: transposase [Acidobacteriota bacterium]
MEDYRRVIIRYSQAFMVKVIGEIEQGQLTVPEAMRLYGIKGSDTIPRWMKKLGKNHLLNRMVRVEVMGEAHRIKELEKEKRELESALAQAQLKIIGLEKLIEIASRESGQDLKKNSATGQSKKSG